MLVNGFKFVLVDELMGNLDCCNLVDVFVLICEICCEMGVVLLLVSYDE